MSVRPLPIAEPKADTGAIEAAIDFLNGKIAQAQAHNCQYASHTFPHGTRFSRATRIAIKKAFLDAGYDIDFYPGGDDFRGGGPTFDVDWSGR